MFLKSLKIESESKVIRDISFKNGLNLIVDETKKTDDKTTGNNVGKTTILKLIDFCLGADPSIIYIDTETKKEAYKLVKDFLVQDKILVTLILKADLDIEDSQEIVIERNFLSRKEKIQRINGQDLTSDEFELTLLDLIIPEQHAEKPTFRQIISHNIRYEDESINNTIRNLSRFTSDAEYETLYLFLFGCEFNNGATKQTILENIRQDIRYRNRLEKTHTKTAYIATLAIIDSEIEELSQKKKDFNLNKDFEKDLNALNQLKYEINKTSSEITKITIKKNLIIEAEEELSARKSDIDLAQLKLIYQQATNKIDNIQKSFDDLVFYHNQMIVEKVGFIKKQLPNIEQEIVAKNIHLINQLNKEKELTLKISKSDSYEALEQLISELNDKFRKKGEYETVIQQLREVEESIRENTIKIDAIGEGLFSDEFEAELQTQLGKFNKHFSSISSLLYGEQYAVKHDIVLNKQKQKLYKFSAFNANMSTGKKQGEISCFDLAYTVFADEENISCLHFLLNDKKELLHGNQLVKIGEFADKKKIQFVASILEDKLPVELNNDKYFIIRLSQKDKLFRIEQGYIKDLS